MWPKGDYPLIEVGVMELNRNPENFFAEVEQAAFSPANIVPGIGFSPGQDAAGAAVLLRRRAALPPRRQLHHIPVNAPKCPFHSYHRDGAMRIDGNLGRTPSYYPQQPRASGGPAAASPSRRCRSTARPRTGTIAWTTIYYSQPGNLFRKMNAAQRRRCSTTPPVRSAARPKQIQERHIANCTKADPAYGAGVAKAIAKLA